MEQQENKVILDAGSALANVRNVTEQTGSFVLVPDDYDVKSLEHLSLHPDRKKGTIRLENAESFVEMVKLHATSDSNIYGRVLDDGSEFTTVFNDHAKDHPDWRDFKAEYNCPLSFEWKEWTKNNGNKMRQAEFAAFIERNLPDIIEPASADMLEISRSLQAKKKVNFASGIRLANGQQELTYEEEIQGTAAKGKLKIPETFKIGVEVFLDGEVYGVECRLRYRIQDANLIIWYEMVRPHEIVEDAAKAVWAYIENQTGKKIFRGQPA